MEGLESVIGRDDQRGVVGAHVRPDAPALDPVLVLVGEAGIGKSMLWSAGIESALQHGVRVLHAAPAAAEKDLAFAVLGDLFSDHLTESLQCDGHQITVRVNENNSKDNGGWGAAVLIDGGSGVLVPTSFSGSLYDVTAGLEIFSFVQTKGGGNANQNQQTISCSDSTVGTLGSFLPPGAELPPGTSADDVVEMSISATAVVQP